MLYTDPVDKNKTMLPSPEDLKFKVNKKKIKTLNPKYYLFVPLAGKLLIFKTI